MLTLHQMHDSGNCYKIRLAAAQLGIPLTLVEYGLHDGSTRKPEYLAKNPNGRVPLLELEDGRYLAESGAILWYLTEGTYLQPTDKWGRAEMLSWMFFEQYSHEPYIAVLRFLKHYATDAQRAARGEDFAKLTRLGNDALGVMERHLQSRDWFAAGRYSIADIALYGYTHAAEEGGFELARYPNIGRWLARVAAEKGYIALDQL